MNARLKRGIVGEKRGFCGANGLGDCLGRGYGGLHQLHLPLLAFAPPRLAHSLLRFALLCSPVDVSGGIDHSSPAHSDGSAAGRFGSSKPWEEVLGGFWLMEFT
jgi:hypothetical protein